MEATQKRGFFKGKLAKAFSRVPKPRTTSHQQCAAGSSPSSSSSSSISNSSAAALFTDQNSANYSSITWMSTYSCATTKHPITRFHEQKSVADLPSSMEKLSIASFNPLSFDHQNGYPNYKTRGHGDEDVDFRAEIFISNEHERFNLDRV